MSRTVYNLLFSSAVSYSVGFIVGCYTPMGHACKPQPKWSAETGIGTSVYPNAPYDGHPYIVEKVDLSLKFRKEW